MYIVLLIVGVLFSFYYYVNDGLSFSDVI